MSNYNNNGSIQAKIRKYPAPPSQLETDPNGVRVHVTHGMDLLLPAFLSGDREATAAMIALAMQVTRVYRDANEDDIGNVLMELGTRSSLKNHKLYLDLSTYPVSPAKAEQTQRSRK
jgi:hypothetical protein